MDININYSIGTNGGSSDNLVRSRGCLSTICKCFALFMIAIVSIVRLTLQLTGGAILLTGTIFLLTGNPALLPIGAALAAIGVVGIVLTSICVPMPFVKMN